MTPEASELSAAKRALLERVLRDTVPNGTIRTVVQQAQTSAAPLANSNWRTPVVPIQPQGSKPPLFYMHVHWQGGAFYCFQLARALGADQPFYVLDLYRFDDLPLPPTIERMAADYIAAMRQIQPEGPYLLGAFCGASLIAYEMAQQLRRAGQAVDFLAFIDPMAGAVRSIRLTGRLMRAIGPVLRLSQGAQLDWFLRLRYLSRVLRRARDEYTEHADRLMREWNQAHPRRFRLLPDGGALRQDWLAVFIWAVSGYRPRPYPGKVTYLFARDNPDPRNLWWGAVREANANADIQTIPGDHVTCRTEHLGALAAQIGNGVSAAQSATPAVPRASLGS